MNIFNIQSQEEIEETFRNTTNEISIGYDKQKALILNIGTKLLNYIGSKIDPKDVATLATAIGISLLKNNSVQQLGAIIGARTSGVLTGKSMATGIDILKGLGGVLTIEDDNTVHATKKHSSTATVTRRISNLVPEIPMVSVPLDWTNNRDGGYYTQKSSIFLGRHTVPHNDVNYSAINKLQKVEFELDEEMMNKLPTFNKYRKFEKLYAQRSFYFTWKYDKRGRSYSVGYPLNIQADEQSKALISFAKQEIIQDYNSLFISIAGYAGLSNLTWQERIDWVRNNLSNLDSIEWKKPILAKKAINAFEATMENESTGYWMELDATSSGIQIMALLSGCYDSADLTNCIDPTVRKNLHSIICDKMNDSLPKHKVDLKTVKGAVMTHYYNSELAPKRVFNEEQLLVFESVLSGLLPGVEDVMGAINDCWDDGATEHSWTLPDGHRVIVPVITPVDYLYDDGVLNVPYRVYENIPSNLKWRSLCPNVIHSIDGYIAREMVRRCNFDLVHIHDCFCFHPNYLDEVRDTYKEIMAEIASSDLLADIVFEITGVIAPSIKRRNLAKEVLMSEYMLS